MTNQELISEARIALDDVASHTFVLGTRTHVLHSFGVALADALSIADRRLEIAERYLRNYVYAPAGCDCGDCYICDAQDALKAMAEVK